MNMKWYVVFALMAVFWDVCQTSASTYSIFQNDTVNEIQIEISDYGLIFTDIKVNGQNVKAMVDFGDMHQLQLSSTLIKSMELPLKKTNALVYDVNGNSRELFEGMVKEVEIGNWLEKEIRFTSQMGEMEEVSQQIGTEFNAVVGWGYFQQYFTEIDYKNEVFRLHKKPFDSWEGWTSIPFSKASGQLLIPVNYQGEEVMMMVDTGSPVTVLDLTKENIPEIGPFTFQIKDQHFRVQAYGQDLSVLADLEILGILGGDFLRMVRMVIDPDTQIIYLQPFD
jgi:predicted aspartyl protease